MKILFLIFFPLSLLTAQPYNFAAPELVAELGNELAEISGLAYTTDGTKELLAVQDELGKVYRLNAASGTILWSTDFWKEGDYEGITTVGDEVWVTKNTGTLYQITNLGQPDQHVTKYNTQLTGDNDVEGLVHDAANSRLLLACKDDVRDDGNDKDGRYLFAFDLSDRTISDEPAYAITRKDLLSYLEANPNTAEAKQLIGFLTDDEYKLAPSALAIHPANGNLYLTSSKGDLLIVLDVAGRVQYLHRFQKEYLPQAEGLTFSPSGTLYISTEAKKGRGARIYRFAPQ